MPPFPTLCVYLIYAQLPYPRVKVTVQFRNLMLIQRSEWDARDFVFAFKKEGTSY